MLLLRILPSILLGHRINEIGDRALHSPIDAHTRLSTRIELDVRGGIIVCARLRKYTDAVQIPAVEFQNQNGALQSPRSCRHR